MNLTFSFSTALALQRVGTSAQGGSAQGKTSMGSKVEE